MTEIATHMIDQSRSTRLASTGSSTCEAMMKKTAVSRPVAPTPMARMPAPRR
jgi:hypothetical protein